ncbi:MAG: capsular polysaccharide biosynthesis protein [Clostridia bacterium]|nr:capsular polysaccharide biosynthesis protein [Clostridia bacterium]
MFRVDFHSHILPGVDDGAKDLQESTAMVDMLCAQGIESIVATPHFRAHRDTVRDFLDRRGSAAEMLKNNIHGKADIYLGAEVALEREISEIEDLPELSYEGTSYILIEFPYRPFSRWMIPEIECILYERHLTPVLAHIDRYAEFFSAADFNEIFMLPGVIFQVNNEAFQNRKSRGIVKTLIKNDLPFVLGSDCHNTENRKPNFDTARTGLRRYDMQPEALNFQHNFLKR